ncbi:hypothetical protein Taro_048502, partial [Colocasia esculenta]|nr:hypothetical protein [Colocasia esculenta]
MRRSEESSCQMPPSKDRNFSTIHMAKMNKMKAQGDGQVTRRLKVMMNETKAQDVGQITRRLEAGSFQHMSLEANIDSSRRSEQSRHVYKAYKEKSQESGLQFRGSFQRHQFQKRKQIKKIHKSLPYNFSSTNKKREMTTSVTTYGTTEETVRLDEMINKNMNMISQTYYRKEKQKREVTTRVTTKMTSMISQISYKKEKQKRE